jgi:PAP_fibrillin
MNRQSTTSSLGIVWKQKLLSTPFALLVFASMDRTMISNTSRSFAEAFSDSMPAISGRRTTSKTTWSYLSSASSDGDGTGKERLLSTLNECLAKAPKNGIDTPLDVAIQIKTICESLEAITPNPTPTRNTELLNGFWYMLWTNYSPAGPSSGKLGPFVGDVYQELQLEDDDATSIARNIFRLDFPIPIMGALSAVPSIHDDTTVAIAFEKVGTKLAGSLPFGPNIEFEKNKEIRLWDHIYVDEEYRILYAKNASVKDEDQSASVTRSQSNSRGFLYVMRRADERRFSTNI